MLEHVRVPEQPRPSPKLEACLDDATLAAHLDASCDEGTRARVDEHLDRCERCRELVAEFAQTFLTQSEPSKLDEETARVLQPGTRLGRYLVLSAVGAGTMGDVYSAHDTELDRKVALKLLRSERPGHDAKGEARILEEARMMAKLTHPSVVAVHDVEVVDGLPFVIMEFVEGPTLRAWCTERRRPPREILRVFLDAARGLAAAHALGIVHRDFKPDNVLIGADGRARITDFGLASIAETISEAERAPISDEGMDLAQPLWTRTGVIVGTPAYMAPEQLEGGLGDARSDQFAFAVALFEGLTGERPFQARSSKELIARVREGKPAKVAERIPGWLRRAVAQAFSALPEDRYPSMDALVAALERDPRRRLGWISAALGVGLVLSASAAMVFHRPTAGSACRADSGPAAPWNAERARAVEGRFRTVAPQLVEEAWPRVRARLDGYARDLDAARLETCEATRVRGTQSERTMELRLQCLDRRRDEVAALTRVLAEADESTVRRATSAAGALTPVVVCSEANAVVAPIPVPDNPSVRSEVEAIRGELARSAALERAGKYREALDWTRPLTERATRSGFLPVRAEALLRQGLLEDESGDSKSARATLLAAVYDAEAGRHDELAADAWVSLVYVTGSQLELHEEAERYEERARAAIARIGGSQRLESRFLLSVGAWLHMRGKFADAVSKLREAVLIAERYAGPTHPDVTEALTWLSQALRESGNVPEAITVAQRALTLREEALGAAHPSVGDTLNALSVGLSRIGRYAEAVPAYERALAIQQQALGPTHPLVASTLSNLGLAYARCGRFDEAIVALDRALRIHIQAWGPEDSEVATAEGNLGYVHLSRRSWPEARLHLERGIAIRERRQGKEHPYVARSLSNLGWVALAEGKTAEARALFERALSILERANGADHPDVAAQLVGIASTLLVTHEAARALPLLERALSIYDTKAPAADKLADARFALARALLDTQRDRAKAIELARDAQEKYASLGGFTEPKRLDVERWLLRNGR